MTTSSAGPDAPERVRVGWLVNVAIRQGPTPQLRRTRSSVMGHRRREREKALRIVPGVNGWTAAVDGPAYASALGSEDLIALRIAIASGVLVPLALCLVLGWCGRSGYMMDLSAWRPHCGKNATVNVLQRLAECSSARYPCFRASCYVYRPTNCNPSRRHSRDTRCPFAIVPSAMLSSLAQLPVPFPD